MDLERGALAVANNGAAPINAAVDVVRIPDQGNPPDHSPGTSSSVSPNSSPSLLEPDGLLGRGFVSDDWQALIRIDRLLAENGIEYHPEAQIDDPSILDQLREALDTSEIEVPDAVSELTHQTFDQAIRPGSLLPPQLAMPERPSTISKMKDNLNFDVAEFFHIDAAAESSSTASQSDGAPTQDVDSSVDNVLMSDTVKHKFDQSVSFEEYLRLSKLQEGARTTKSNSLIEKRGHLASAPKRIVPGAALRFYDEPKYRADPDVNVLNHAFKAGGEDFFLPAFSDPVYDAEFAAFAAAGKSANQQFRGVRRELESRKQAAKLTPSPSRVSSQNTSTLSPALDKDEEFARAGLIYVAHTMQQNPELSNTPEDTGHTYTKEEIQWARNYLSDDVKIWMKRSCGVVGTKMPAWTGLDKVLKKAVPNSEQVFNHSACQSSPMPEKQLPKNITGNLSYWAEHDQMMSLSELDTEWDAFEKSNSPTKTISDGLQTPVARENAICTSAKFSQTSIASFVTAEDDEMAMIPTFSTPDVVTHTPGRSQMGNVNNVLLPRAGVAAYGDSPFAPIVTKLSNVTLNSRGEPGTDIDPKAAETSATLFTCITCNKVYKKKAYLLKHEAEGNCEPKNPNTPKLAVFAGVSTMKLSMTDQELIHNGLPSMEARNHKSMSYCTACNKEFSTVGRLRFHVLKSCPILRERGVYNKPQDQQVDDQKAAVKLPRSNNTGYLMMDEGEPETGISKPFSKHDLGNLQESLGLSDTPINVVGVDNNFAPNTINGPRPSPAIKSALFPVSIRSPDEVKFPQEGDCIENTPDIRRIPGQAILSTPRRLQQLNLVLPGSIDLSVMEENDIGEKVCKADSMAEIPALHQSHDPSPLKSTTPALIRSIAQSENILGSQSGHFLAPKLSSSNTALKGGTYGLHFNANSGGKGEGLILPKGRDDGGNDEKESGLKYPARVRLFSKELALGTPDKPGLLEPFEDLPPTLKRARASNASGVSPALARSTTQQASAARDMLEQPTSVTFSFTNESDCATATQTLEELIIGSIDPTLQSLRMWPSFSKGPSASKSTFEFKVTAPQSIDLVAALRELFPLMFVKVQDNRVFLVPKDMRAKNSGSTADLMPGIIQDPAVVVVKAKKMKKMEKQGAENPRRSSRLYSGELEFTSQSPVEANMEDGSQDPKEVKRRRLSSRLSEPHAE